MDSDLLSEISADADELGNQFSRCIVCTLPVGQCEHSSEWLKHRLPPEFSFEPEVDEVQEELEQLLGVLGSDHNEFQTTQLNDDVELDCLSWSTAYPVATDRIGDTVMVLSSPSERGWHTTVQMTLPHSFTKLIVLFGGFRYKDGKCAPQPFMTTNTFDSANEPEYLNDLCLFDVHACSWHRPMPVDGQKWPQGRYGHCATAVGGDKMVIYGGRGKGGQILNDVWLLRLTSGNTRTGTTWECLCNEGGKYDEFKPYPAERFFASCCAIPSSLVINGEIHTDQLTSTSENVEDKYFDDVLLFGGTNGEDNFNDVWILKSHGYIGSLRPYGHYWSRTFIGGIPPTPRYGHQMLVLPVGTVLILGGCAVGPRAELEWGGGTAATASQESMKSLQALALSLQESYTKECEEAIAGGETIETLIRIAPKSFQQSDTAPSPYPTVTSLLVKTGAKDLTRKAGEVAARVAVREAASTEAERRLGLAWRGSQAAAKLSLGSSARHSEKYLDVHFLDVASSVWKPQMFPPISGQKPAARVHMGCVALGSYVLLVGGAEPTCLRNRCVDSMSSSSSLMRVWALSLLDMRWRLVSGREGLSSFMTSTLTAALSEERRAQTRCEAEKAKGLSLGVTHGMTVEYLQARAVRDVMIWRRKEVEQKLATVSVPPSDRWGLTLAVAGGRRAVLLCGWEDPVAADRELHPSKGYHVLGKAADTEKLVYLDVENDLEKSRRIEDEFHARLERERILTEALARQQNAVSLHDLRKYKEQEEKREAAELAMMMREEIRSSLPPLTRPSPVRLVKANEHTMWLQWDAVTVNSSGYPLPVGQPTYYLYLRGGYEILLPGQEVWALPQSLSASANNNGTCFDCNGYEEEKNKYYAGLITGISTPPGFVNVEYSDGFSEKKVPRRRLHKRYPKQNYQQEPYVNPVVYIRRHPNEAKTTQSQKKNAKRDRLEIPYRSVVDYDPLVIQTDPSWRLVYAGPATSYECLGLVPLDIIEKEKEITVSAIFRLQTLGTEFPVDERSLPSFGSCYYTCNKFTDPLVSFSFTQQVSRPRKELFSAIVQGTAAVQLERNYNTIIGEGKSVHFL